MCWNADVSLNTFLFSMFVLLLVFYNNHYTKYKIQYFDNKWMYVFLISAFSMQLIEYFIWKNIKNDYYNKIFTICALFLVFFQPVASLMLLGNHSLRNILLSAYLLIGIPILIYTIYTEKLISVVSKKSGNLIWSMDPNGVLPLWTVALLFSFVYEKNWVPVILAIISLSIFVYKEFSSAGSVWCWFINSISVYLAIYLLFYLPYIENQKIC